MNLLEYKIKLRKAKREKIVICLCLAVYMVFTIFLIVMKYTNNDYIGLEIANLCFRSLKFVADVYIHFLFLSLLNFIVYVRKKGP